MPFWPFRRTLAELLSPEELQNQMIQNACASSRKLHAWCRLYKAQLVANAEFLRKVPERLRGDDYSVHLYMQSLIGTANYLAENCHAPELLNALIGDTSNNSLLRIEEWLKAAPQRMHALEYGQLIDEVHEHLKSFESTRGPGRDHYETLLQGKLGELLAHSGTVEESIRPFERALELCRNTGDFAGVFTYVSNLLEVYRYLGDIDRAIQCSEELVKLCEERGEDAAIAKQQLQRLREGEPKVRVVCTRDERRWELSDIESIDDGCYKFHFERNRMTLGMCETLTNLGMELASKGQKADAMEKFSDAAEVDPYDPHPLYQWALCLTELGAHEQAVKLYDDIEDLAPGWFHSRTFRWIAAGLADGSIEPDQFLLLRMIDDGGLAPADALQYARAAVEKYADFAPYYLSLGKLLRDRKDEALTALRRGLECAEEPDIECRLLVELAAGHLSEEPMERTKLLDRVIELNGNLVAHAGATLTKLKR